VDNERDIWIQEVDSVLKDWRQGDCVMGVHWFVHRFDPKHPLTTDSAEVVQVDQETDLSESEVKGFVVVSQTCDIVPHPPHSSCTDRPFIEIVPLIEINTQFLESFNYQRDKNQFLDEVQKGKRPRFAYIPGVADYYLVAELDRVMTVEKAVVAEWQRIPGCQNDQEVRALGNALARKRIRFAFPDDFNKFVKRLQDRMKEKHDRKESPEGIALRALREIRVRAEPSWNASEVQLMFWFIRHEQQSQFEGIGWDQFLKQWSKLIPETGRFSSVEGLVVSLEDMTAKDYIESDPLDLDHLSS
jgi:hypothetical protein